MNIFNRIMSLTLTVMMLFTNLPVRASDFALNKHQNPQLQGKIAQTISESLPENSSGKDSFNELTNKATKAVKKMNESSPSAEEVVERIRNSTPAEQELFKKELKKLDAKKDKLLIENQQELNKFPSEQKKAMAGATVSFDELRRDAKKVSSDPFDDFFEVYDKEPVSGKIAINAAFMSVVSFSLSSGFAFADLLELLITGTKSSAGMSDFFLTQGITFALVSAGFFAVRYYAYAATPYYSDKIMVSTAHGRTPGNKAQIKKEFLADPLGAITYYVTQSTDVALVYNTDEQGATMFSDAIDILFYAPNYNPQDAKYRDYFAKTLFTKTIYWQKLSDEDKAKYLHRLAKKLKNDTRKEVINKFNQRMENIGKEQTAIPQFRP